jgi:hypothetical protein
MSDYETIRIKDKELFFKAKMKACEERLTLLEWTEKVFKEALNKD